MNKQPYFYKGRFYNDQHDSIMQRIKHFLKCCWRIACKRFFSGDYRKILAHVENSRKQWVTKPNLETRKHNLTITWLGHASFLIQINNFNIITDPVFDRISCVAPRLLSLPIDVAALPPIDVILISHNHADHCDEYSLKILQSHNPSVLVPLGNKTWFSRLGFSQVTEMTWWEKVSFRTGSSDNILLTSLPAVHWTSRGLFDINKSLWCSWMINSDSQSVYFAGDTAYGEHFSSIQKQFSSIDVALMPIGPNEPRDLMADVHVSSEESVQAFLDLGAECFIPMHWGTFMFGLDDFGAPLERLKIHWQREIQKLHNKILSIGKIGEQWVFEKKAISATLLSRPLAGTQRYKG